MIADYIYQLGNITLKFVQYPKIKQDYKNSNNNYLYDLKCILKHDIS